MKHIRNCKLAYHATTNVSVASSTNLLKKVELGSTLCNVLLQRARLKFVAWQVEHVVVIRATTRLTYNATMLHHKLNENVAHNTWPSIEVMLFIWLGPYLASS